MSPTAAQTARINRGRGHSYLLDGQKVPGVTTVLGKGFPKPALTNWAVKTAASLAVDQWDELADLPVTERLERIKRAPWEDRDAAANRGTEVHRLAEHLAAGEKVDVPDELAGHVESYVRFLDEWDVTPVLLERPVFNRAFSYAGTLDLVADLADGTRRLIDVKTNRSGPFPEVALQLAAYRFAECYLDEEAEIPMPEVDACAVCWVRADGYELVPVTAGETQLRMFRYVAMVAGFIDAPRDAVIGDALAPPQESQ